MISKTHRNPLFSILPKSGAIVPPTHPKRPQTHAMPSNKSNNHKTLTPPYPAKTPNFTTEPPQTPKLTALQ